MIPANTHMCSACNTKQSNKLQKSDIRADDSVTTSKPYDGPIDFRLKGKTVLGAQKVRGLQEFGRKLSLTLTTTATNIDTSAFQDATWFSSVIFPATFTSVGICAFEGCSAITSVTLPDHSLTTVDAFEVPAITDSLTHSLTHSVTHSHTHTHTHTRPSHCLTTA